MWKLKLEHAASRLPACRHTGVGEQGGAVHILHPLWGAPREVPPLCTKQTRAKPPGASTWEGRGGGVRTDGRAEGEGPAFWGGVVSARPAKTGTHAPAGRAGAVSILGQVVRATSCSWQPLRRNAMGKQVAAAMAGRALPAAATARAVQEASSWRAGAPRWCSAGHTSHPLARPGKSTTLSSMPP
jgi:hypothetical protein